MRKTSVVLSLKDLSHTKEKDEFTWPRVHEELGRYNLIGAWI